MLSFAVERLDVKLDEKFDAPNPSDVRTNVEVFSALRMEEFETPRKREMFAILLLTPCRGFAMDLLSSYSIFLNRFWIPHGKIMFTSNLKNTSVPKNRPSGCEHWFLSFLAEMNPWQKKR